MSQITKRAISASLKHLLLQKPLGKITINDMVLYAVAKILPNYPEINANLVDNSFRKFKHANVGMAVDTDRGLLVPVIFGAEKLTEDMNTLLNAVIKAKPAAAKGQYIRSCVVASTMGPGVKVNTAKL